MSANIDNYAKFFNSEFLMGPNSIYLLDELLTKYPLCLQKNDTVLDLGCGKGLTSLFIANETGASVCANDLWINGEENLARFKEWGIADYVTPCHEDAVKLRFEKEKFSAIISIDAYHYFAGEPGFFSGKILPFVKSGGIVLIAIPGIRSGFEGRQDELLSDWLGDEAYMFRSVSDWISLIGDPPEIKTLNVWEMDCFSKAWDSWLSTDHEFAAGDRAKFDTVINRYTCFIGIAVVKK